MMIDNKIIHKKTCLNCSNSFESEFDTKKYCSQNCKQDHFYKRKFNSEFTDQRKSTETSINDNKHIPNENFIKQDQPGEEKTDGYLQKYIESLNQISELKTKLEIANFRLENYDNLNPMDDEEEEEENEKEKFYKTLNGLLPLAMSALIKPKQNTTS